MSKCLLLLKIKFLGFFNPNAFFHGNAKEKRRLIIMAIPILICIIAVIASNIGMAVAFSSLGLSKVLPSFMLMMCSLVAFILTFMTSNSILFGFKDYDMIMSMPVTNTTVIISRLVAGYILNLLFSIITLLPSMIIYSMNVQISAKVWIMMIMSIFLVPILPMIIASIIGIIISMVTIKMRHSNILNIVFNIVVTIVLLIIFYGAAFSVYTQGLGKLGMAMDNSVNTFYPPAVFFRSMLINDSLYDFGIFAIISLLPAILFIGWLSFFYVKISSILSNQNIQNIYKIEKTKSSSQFIALYVKEFRRLVTSTVYCVNSLIGAILLLVASIAIFIIGPEVIGKSVGIPNYVDMLRKAVPFLVCIFLSISSTTSSSISFEGKNRWIPFSMPVEPKTIYTAKIATNITITIPVILFSCILLAIRLKLSALEIIFLMITPIIFTCFIAVLGLYFNIKFPRFDWTTEDQAVKQGVPLIITMGTGTFVGLVLIALSLLFNINSLVICVFASSIILLATIILYKNMNKLVVHM